jgi:hypothetical protein
MLSDSRLHILWRKGIPPHLRCLIWPLSAGNSLRITPAVFSMAQSRVKDVLKLLKKKKEEEDKRTSVNVSNSPSSSPRPRESSSSPKSVTTPVTKPGGLFHGSKLADIVKTMKTKNKSTIKNDNTSLSDDGYTKHSIHSDLI